MPEIKFGNRNKDVVFLELKHYITSVSKRVEANVVYGGVLRWSDQSQCTDLNVNIGKVERQAIGRVAGQILESPCLEESVANPIATALLCSDRYNNFV